MKSITLISPSSGFVEDQFAIPNISLLLLQAYYRKQTEVRDVTVHYMHEHDNDYSTIPEADIYGISLVTPNFSEGKKIYSYLRRERNAFVYAGGPHVSADPEYCVDRVCDWAVTGAGEGLFTGETGIRIVDGGQLCPDVYSELTLDYRDIASERYKSWLLMTDVGCRGACRFCYKMQKGLKRFPWSFTKRCIEDYLRMPGDKKYLKLTSDNVFWNTDYELFNFLGENYDRLSYEVCARFDDVDKQSLCYFNRMNCGMIKFGMESGSNKVLSLMNKRITSEHMLYKSRLVKDTGMRFGVYLIVGFPGETQEDREMTARAVREMSPDWYSVYRFTPYPGTPVWREMPESEKQKHRDTDFQHFYHAGSREDRDPLVAELENMIEGG